MIKFLVAIMLFFAAPGLAYAKAPTKCPKGDKACEKKKAKAAKNAKGSKTAKKADKKNKKVVKKVEKKTTKKVVAKKPAKKKKVAEQQIAPFNDTGEPGAEATDASTPAPDTLSPPESATTAMKTDAPAASAASAKGDMEEDIFPESSASGSSAPSTSGSSDGIGSDADFELGDDLPTE